MRQHHSRLWKPKPERTLPSSKLFNAIVNAPSIEAALVFFFQSIVDDERRTLMQKAARARRQEARTIRVPDLQARALRHLIVDEIKTDGVPVQFKARLAGRLADTHQRASVYVLADGQSFGPLNIFGR